jgi:hypothetical protein
MQLAAPQVFRWLQLVIQQLEGNNDGYQTDDDDDRYSMEDDDPPVPPIPTSALAITGVFSITAFNEHVQKTHDVVTYTTSASGPGHMLTWVSDCTSKLLFNNIAVHRYILMLGLLVNGSIIGHGTAYKKSTAEAAAAEDAARKLFWASTFRCRQNFALLLIVEQCPLTDQRKPVVKPLR